MLIVIDAAPCIDVTEQLLRQANRHHGVMTRCRTSPSPFPFLGHIFCITQNRGKSQRLDLVRRPSLVKCASSASIPPGSRNSRPKREFWPKIQKMVFTTGNLLYDVSHHRRDTSFVVSFSTREGERQCFFCEEERWPDLEAARAIQTALACGLSSPRSSAPFVQPKRCDCRLGASKSILRLARYPSPPAFRPLSKFWGVQPMPPEDFKAPSRPKPSRQRKPNLAAAIKQAKKAGMSVSGAVLETDGRLSLTFGELTNANSVNSLDTWIMKNARTTQGNQ